MENNESFIPYVGKIIDIKQETPDEKNCSTTFQVSVQCSSYLE